MIQIVLIIASVLFNLALGFIGLAAWFKHVIFCLSVGKWGLLLVGGLFFPIGVIHGIGLWLGAF